MLKTLAPGEAATDIFAMDAITPAARAAFNFDNTFADAMKGFFARTDPVPVAAPRMIRFNRSLALELGLDPDILDTPAGAEILAGSALAGGSEPIALAYAGHQFGGFSPQLGDGRAILLGEIVDKSGNRRDIQLKGSGRTPFSRGGDGRAALGPVLREYLISDAMHALGVPTTRSLAAVATGEGVRRETLLPGAVLTRVAASHIRIGTFQFFAARGETDKVRRLADYAIARHYPGISAMPEPYLAFFSAVLDRQAALVARWMLVGFIHGVMNTDNMAISGETIDYGPCAFMNAYDRSTVYSSIDRQGRYAYGNQPSIAQWNLARFAETLLPLIDPDQDRAVARATAALEEFPDRYAAHWLAGMRAKLGLRTVEDGDSELANGLLAAMRDARADYTLTFRRLGAIARDENAAGDLRALFGFPHGVDDWLARWRERLAREGGDLPARAAAMDAVNPACIPRNHLVEEALAAAREGDMTPFDALHAVLLRPFDDKPGNERYALPPDDADEGYQTFCGT